MGPVVEEKLADKGLYLPPVRITVQEVQIFLPKFLITSFYFSELSRGVRWDKVTMSDHLLRSKIWYIYLSRRIRSPNHGGFCQHRRTRRVCRFGPSAGRTGTAGSCWDDRHGSDRVRRSRQMCGSKWTVLPPPLHTQGTGLSPLLLSHDFGISCQVMKKIWNIKTFNQFYE